MTAMGIRKAGPSAYLVVAGLAVAAILLGLAVAAWSADVGLIAIALLLLPWLILVEGAPVWLYLFAFPSIAQIETSYLSAPKLLVIVCLGAWLAGAVVGRQKVNFHLSGLDLAIVALFATGFLSILFASLAGRENLLLVAGQSFALYFLVRWTGATRQGLLRAAVALAAGAALAALVAVWGYLHGAFIDLGGVQRLAEAGIGINTFAAILVAAAGVAGGLVADGWSRAWRVVGAVGLAVLVVAIALSKSRGALVGLLAIVVLGLVLLGRRRIRLMAGIGAALVLAGVLVADVPGIASAVGLADYRGRFLQLFQSGAGAGVDNEHVYMWRIALEAFREHPLAGLGVGNFVQPGVWFPLAQRAGIPPDIFGPNDAHSFYLGILAERGLLGGVPLAFILWLALTGVWRALRIAPGGPSPRVEMPVAFGLVGYFTAAAFIPVDSFVFSYLLLGMAAALAALAPRAHEFAGLSEANRTGKGPVVAVFVATTAYEGAEGGYTTEATFQHMLPAFCGAFASIQLCLPVLPSGAGTAREPVPTEGCLRVRALPGFRNGWEKYLTRLPAYIVGCARLFRREAKDWDLVWIVDGELHSQVVYALTVLYRKRAFLYLRDRGERQTLHAGRTGWRRIFAVVYGAWLRWSIGGLTRQLPSVVTGDELRQKYGADQPQMHQFVSTLVRREDLKRGAIPRTGPNARPTIVVVGRIAPIKGVEHVIRALALLPSETKARLRLIGPAVAPYRTELLRLAASLGVSDRIHFAGEIPFGPRLWQEYEAADIYVHPSLSEGTPKTLIEAFAAGLPVVASNVGGLPGLVGADGLLVPVGDARALALAIASLLGDSSLWLRFRKASARKAERLTIETQADLLVGFLASTYPELAIRSRRDGIGPGY